MAKAKTPTPQRLFAVVDIETTGGHAAAHGITEIAIIVHNGKKVTERFHSLINPGCEIPRFITGLTGITNEMVAEAPEFDDLAAQVFELLHGKVFVAHNVNFDYSFVKHHLLAAGFELNTQKLCTVRLSRKVFPGLKSYSLGNICGHLSIRIDDRHRATGDANATVKLLEKIMHHDEGGHIDAALKRGSKEYLLPPDLLKEDMDKLPPSPGVYYFHDKRGKIIYVGKAKHLKRRVTSHFSNNSVQKQKQDFLRQVKRISFVETGNELFAHIHELIDIKEKWPDLNRAQKGYTPRFGLFSYQDQNGYQRLEVKTIGRYQQPLYYFKSVHAGLDFLREQAMLHQLCFRLCGLQRAAGACENHLEGICHGACVQQEDVVAYNTKVEHMLAETLDQSFIVTESGRNEQELGVLLVEQGNFWGFGYVPKNEFVNEREWVRAHIPRAKWFPGIDQLIQSYLLHTAPEMG